MFFGIAPLGNCGRVDSAVSRLSSALTSLPLTVRGSRMRRPPRRSFWRTLLVTLFLIGAIAVALLLLPAAVGVLLPFLAVLMFPAVSVLQRSLR